MMYTSTKLVCSSFRILIMRLSTAIKLPSLYQTLCFLDFPYLSTKLSGFYVFFLMNMYLPEKSTNKSLHLSTSFVWCSTCVGSHPLLCIAWCYQLISSNQFSFLFYSIRLPNLHQKLTNKDHYIDGDWLLENRIAIKIDVGPIFTLQINKGNSI